MKRLACALLLISCAASAQAPGSSVRYRRLEEIDWKVSGLLPPSAEFHLIYEDKTTHGVQAMVRFPSAYTLPSHSHSVDETLTIVKGKLVVDVGGTAPLTLGPGSYVVIPAGVQHSLKAKGEVVMLLTVSGSYDVKGLPSVR